MAKALILLLLLAFPAAADSLGGVARIIDGDTLQIGGTKVRLLGIDAPETSQLCENVSGTNYECGRAATAALRGAIEGDSISCSGSSYDRYRRLIAVCRRGDIDLNGWLVAQGWALAYRRYSAAYVAAEDAARAAHRGIWAGRFMPPWIWRRLH